MVDHHHDDGDGLSFVGRMMKITSLHRTYDDDDGDDCTPLSFAALLSCSVYLVFRMKGSTLLVLTR